MISAVFIILGILCLFIFIAPLGGIVFNIGSALGIASGCALILYGIFRKRMGSKLRRLVHVLAALALAGLLVLGGMQWYGTRQQPDEGQAVTMIILGCRVNGSVPSLMLWNRINTARQYLAAHPEVKAVCSGGQGDDEHISEAQCIYEQLVQTGIDPERLYLEDESSSTKENIAFSQRIIRENGLPEAVLLVTNDYHCFRALQLAQKAGLAAYAWPGRTALYLVPTYVLRECCGILYMWLFG